MFHDFEPNVTVQPAETTPESVFIGGAVRAAQHSSKSIQEKIIDDLAGVLGSTRPEVEFLLRNGSGQQDLTIYDFPDSERRRRVIRANSLEAAE